MRPVLLSLTTSLDGFIADADGGIEWIAPPPENVPDEFIELLDAVDAFVMGRATYELSLRLPGGMDLFVDKSVYVITSHTDLEPRAGVEFVHESPEAFVARLKAEPGGTIWLFGGGQLATALSSAGLVDEYQIVVQPILLGDGIRLWQSGLGRTALEQVYAREWANGLAELRYRPMRTGE